MELIITLVQSMEKRGQVRYVTDRATLKSKGRLKEYKIVLFNNRCGEQGQLILREPMGLHNSLLTTISRGSPGSSANYRKSPLRRLLRTNNVHVVFVSQHFCLIPPRPLYRLPQDWNFPGGGSPDSSNGRGMTPSLPMYFLRSLSLQSLFYHLFL